MRNHKITYGAHVYGYQIRIDYEFGACDPHSSMGNPYDTWTFGNQRKEDSCGIDPRKINAVPKETLLEWAEEWACNLARKFRVSSDNVAHNPAIDDYIRKTWNHVYNLEY